VILLESLGFVYRLPIHLLDGTITSDIVIVIVGVRICGQSASAMLSNRVQMEIAADLPEVSVEPATLLVAAGKGTLLAPAFALKRIETSHIWLCLAGRTAWRLPDVAAGTDRLELAITWAQAGATNAQIVRPNVRAWVVHARGQALCAAAVPVQPALAT